MGNYHAEHEKTDSYGKGTNGKTSLPLRIYFRTDNIDALSKLSTNTGASMSSLVNASVKVGLLENRKAVIRDAKGAKNNG